MAQLKLDRDLLLVLQFHQVDDLARTALDEHGRLLDLRLVPHRHVEYRKFCEDLSGKHLRQTFLVEQGQRVRSN